MRILTVENGFVVAVSNSRSSSAVLHSPTGAFEPVHSSTSRTGSLSESEPSVHVPHHGKFTRIILISVSRANTYRSRSSVDAVLLILLLDYKEKVL